MKRKRLGGLAVALALGLGVTSVVPAPVAAAAVEAGWSDEMSLFCIFQVCPAHSAGAR